MASSGGDENNCDLASMLRSWLMKPVTPFSEEEFRSVIIEDVTDKFAGLRADQIALLERRLADLKDGNLPDHQFASLVILAGNAARQHLAEREEREEPPSWAEKLLYLVLSNQDRAAIPGDLEEEYRTVILPKFGRRYARIWYWKQVLASAWPLIRGLAYRLAAGAGIWKAVKAFRRIDF